VRRWSGEPPRAADGGLRRPEDLKR